MSTNDFMFIVICLIVAVSLIMAIIGICSSDKILSTPKRVIRKERIRETSESEIWRTNIYSLDTIKFDTISKKTSWDTAHELPR